MYRIQIKSIYSVSQVKMFLLVILLGAKVNWVNEDDECKTALHQSILGVCLIYKFVMKKLFLGVCLISSTLSTE